VAIRKRAQSTKHRITDMNNQQRANEGEINFKNQDISSCTSSYLCAAMRWRAALHFHSHLYMTRRAACEFFAPPVIAYVPLAREFVSVDFPMFGLPMMVISMGSLSSYTPSFDLVLWIEKL
jgi:hypothetical protein